MLRHNHDDDWKTPLRPREGRLSGRLYENPDFRRERWSNEPPSPTPLGKAWQARIEERNRLEKLEQELAQQRQRLDALESRAGSCMMEIHTFSPEPYHVKKPIPVTVREHNGEFLASFLDANVNASGETEQEAFQAIKNLMLDMFDHLSREPKLGPKLATRLAVLREFIDGP